jgi:hypothetical protein
MNAYHFQCLNSSTKEYYERLKCGWKCHSGKTELQKTVFFLKTQYSMSILLPPTVHTMFHIFPRIWVTVRYCDLFLILQMTPNTLSMLHLPGHVWRHLHPSAPWFDVLHTFRTETPHILHHWEYENNWCTLYSVLVHHHYTKQFIQHLQSTHRFSANQTLYF